VKNFLRLSAVCLFTLSCVVTPGCSEPEKAAPTDTSASADGSGEKEADGSGTKAEADGSATK